MLSIGTFHPKDDKWQCALCPIGEQGKLLTMTTNSTGTAMSFICRKHRNMTMREIVAALDVRASKQGNITFEEEKPGAGVG